MIKYDLILLQGDSLYGNEFDAFGRVQETASSNNMTVNEVLAQLDNAGIIQKRFLQLNVQYTNNLFTKLQDVAAFPIDAMLSQLGGVLSLWLGVSVMFLFEVIEFCITLVIRYWERKRNPAAIKVMPVGPNLV